MCIADSCMPHQIHHHVIPILEPLPNTVGVHNRTTARHMTLPPLLTSLASEGRPHDTHAIGPNPI